MKMKNKVLIISAFSVLVIIMMYLISQGKNQDKELVIDRELVMTLSIYPNRRPNPGYVFSISTDQILQIHFRRSGLFGRRVDEYKEKLLTDNEFQLIMELLEAVSLDDHSNEGRLRSLGGWEVQLLYNGTIYEAN